MIELILVGLLSFPSHYCPEPTFLNRPFNRAANVRDQAVLDMYNKCIKGYMKQAEEAAYDKEHYNSKQVLRKMRQAVNDAERIRREYDRGL